MNQNRWTCLATVVLTTMVSPITIVAASTPPSPVVGSGAKYLPISPQSLPTITPLVVTEIETQSLIPANVQPVPLVSKLPIVIPITRVVNHSFRSRHHRVSKVNNFVTNKTYPLSAVAKLPSIAPVFSTKSHVSEPILPIASPISSTVAIVNPVAPLPSIMTVRAPQTPGLAGSASKTPQVAAIATKIETQPTDSLQQVVPIASYPKELTDAPSFESGTPVFGLNRDRVQQIVATAIAQVGDTIVAPEPSIAIPVELPKQQAAPAKLLDPVPSIPVGTGIVKIEQPNSTIKPALDKIVATQTGQASWYGSEGGSQTANGEKYNPSGLTAAHRTLPFGTKVRVTSLKTGKTVTVRINDRGPFHSRRIIDVSAGAAAVIGIKDDGIGDVRMEIIAKQSEIPTP